MGTADLHLHTSLGDGLPTPVQILDYVETRTDLDVIAITEHDSIVAAHRVRELHARRGDHRFEVVSGVEVTTLAGHLIALFVEEPIPSLRPLSKTIDLIHRQGGLCIIPHPLSPLTRSLGQRAIERILRRRADGLWFDGIELSNPSPAGRVTSARARRLNEAVYHISEVGGSDAHYLPAIGCTHTTFDGRTAAELRSAIVAGATGAVAGRYPSLRSIGPSAIVLQSWRALWATPRQVVGRPFMRAVRGITRTPPAKMP
ncbi:MAG: PHP domain-containing protein [Chloroflexi bacterium]|nr:PHP domain-containing protein [Chloroflexota bacterium]